MCLALFLIWNTRAIQTTSFLKKLIFCLVVDDGEGKTCVSGSEMVLERNRKEEEGNC